MWLCTQHGFFSIDMENLVKLCGAAWPIIVCGQAEVSDVMAKLATAIDYSNFKSRIHAKPDQADKSSAYSQLWSHLYDLQE